MDDDGLTSNRFDPLRINARDDFELLTWADRLGVDESRVLEAVKWVGDKSDDVAQYLKRGLDSQGLRT